MSSHYTTISCREWDEMHESIRRAESYAIRDREENQRLLAAETARRQQMEAIRKATQATINSAQDYLASAYAAASEQLGTQVRAQLTNRGDAFSTQISDLRASAADLSAKVTEASAAIDQISADFSKAVSEVLGNLPQEEKRAQRTLQELDKLIAKLQPLRPVGKNLAALSSLENMRDTAASNFCAGDYQAAIIVTQGSILTASRALTSAIVERERSDAELALIQSSFSDLQAQLSRLASKEGLLSYEIGGERYECDYDIDYWSHGLFSELAKQADELKKSIQQAEEGTVEPAALRSMAAQVKALRSRMEACDQEARRDFAGTLALEDTVQRLYTGLEGRGWSIESSGHQDDDVRKPYTMTCTDTAGNTVSIVGAGGERPEIPAFFYEAFADSEGMASLVKESIAATLQDEGINIESDVERNDCASMLSPEKFVEHISHETEYATARRRESVRRQVESAR